MQDINIGKLREMCFRQSKIPGEFMLQLRTPGGTFRADLADIVQEVANKYGDGRIHLGTRQTLDITGIKYEYVDEVLKLIEPFIHEIENEVSGVEMETKNGYPYIGPRNVMACIGGDHCIKAAQKSQEMARKIEKIIYPAPYHVKIAVSGCPNDCTKGQFSDFGIIGVTKPVYDQDRCIGCEGCVEKCEQAATRVLSLNEETHKIDKDPCCCVGCGECVSRCPTGAWRRPDVQMWNIVLGGRSGKQYPRMGQMFAKWLTTDSVLQIFSNWHKFSEWVMGGEPKYLHGGHLIDIAGYQAFKEHILDGVKLNPEALISENVLWTEKEYRSNIHLKPLSKHKKVKTPKE
ncbi:MAG: sulfite reductase subunit C [Peptoniphilaceae bacterium]|nr:sulfite reductase subunit C [Peptoniphilaceae bacterium]MDY3738551.1 sulfite reductase subunit C [Peptoniphilaceae bacterium]